MSVVSWQGNEALVRKKDPVKEEPAKELSPRKESCLVKIVEERQRLHIKGRLHVNCSGNCFEELFSFLKRKKRKKKRATIYIFVQWFL